MTPNWTTLDDSPDNIGMPLALTLTDREKVTIKRDWRGVAKRWRKWVMRSFGKVDLFVNNDDVILRPTFGLRRFGPESAVNNVKPQANRRGGELPFQRIRLTGM